jgi:hypothetical protein
MISVRSPVAASVNVAANCWPADGFGNSTPVPDCTVRDVAALVIGAASELDALFAKMNCEAIACSSSR